MSPSCQRAVCSSPLRSGNTGNKPLELEFAASGARDRRPCPVRVPTSAFTARLLLLGPKVARVGKPSGPKGGIPAAVVQAEMQPPKCGCGCGWWRHLALTLLPLVGRNLTASAGKCVRSRRPQSPSVGDCGGACAKPPNGTLGGLGRLVCVGAGGLGRSVRGRGWLGAWWD